MRFLKRTLLSALIVLPLFYLVGLPYLMRVLEEKIRADQYVQCQQHLEKEGITAMLKSEQSNHYCTCVSSSVKLDRDDLIDMAQRKKPKKLAAILQPAVEACNTELKTYIGNTARNLPRRIEIKPDGTQIIHFN